MKDFLQLLLEKFGNKDMESFVQCLLEEEKKVIVQMKIQKLHLTIVQ